MKRLLIGTLLLTIFLTPALADDDTPETATDRQARVSIKIFQKEFKTRDIGRKMNALLSLAQVQHPDVVDVLAKKGLADKNPDVRDATAQLFGDMGYAAEQAGEYLKKSLKKNEKFPEVQVSIIRSIGKLKYTGAFEELKEAAKRLNETKYQWVTVEVVRTFGALDDPACLPFLLWMSEYGGHALKWSTGTVVVDTGAAGDKDQRAAEAAWKAKYGHVKPKRPPAPIIRTYMQELQKTVKKLTGQEFKNATEFRKWLIANAEELGLDPRKLSK
jgi:hypothetical protein